MHRRSRLPLLLPFLAPCLLQPAGAAIHTVRPAGDGDFPTIQAAVNAAVDGDEVVLEGVGATFSGPGNYAVDFLGKAITIRSESRDPFLCYLFATPAPGGPPYGNAFFFLNGEGPGSVLEGVTILGGNDGTVADHDVPGIVAIQGASPVIRNVILQTNTSLEGAGGTVMVEDGSVTLEGCQFLGNHGAGLWLVTSAADLSGCHFEKNRSTSRGGAIAMWSSDLTLTSSRLLRNGEIANPLTMQGGGIYAFGGTVTVTDCEIVENVSTDRGGGIFLDGGATAQLLRTTVAANRADTGGGIHGVSGSASLDACIVWGNCAVASGADVFLEAGAALTFDCSDVNTASADGPGMLVPGPGSVSLDPEFCNPLLCTFIPNFTASYALEGTSPLFGLGCGIPGAPLTPCSSTSAGSISTSSWGRIKAGYR